MNQTNGLRKSIFAIFTFVLCGTVQSSELRLPPPGAFFVEGSSLSNRMALSFDDGPGPRTEEILTILDQYKARATFFMLGEQVEERPEIAQEVKRRGHEVANHTYGHFNFYRVNKSTTEVKRLTNEIVTSQNVIKKYTGVEPRLLRMPYGYMQDWVKEIAQEQGYVLVNWTAGYDWKKWEVDEMYEGYLNFIRPGAILLFHDGGRKRQKTIDLIQRLLPKIKEKGLEIVTVGELLSEPTVD